MKILNAKFRITMGQTGIIVSLIMLAFYLGIVPDKINTIREGRTSLAETIAVYSTSQVIHVNNLSLKNDFNLIVERNADLLSAALRRKSGRTLVSTGNHNDHWQPMSGEYSKNSQVRVPIWAGKHKWGQLELRFKPLNSSGIWSFMDDPMIRMILFMMLGCIVAFLLLPWKSSSLS